MRASQGRLIDPIREEREIYPYRRVWGTLIAEHVILFGGAAVVFVFANLLGIQLPGALESGLSAAFALLPVALWLIFSVFRERSARQPRERLVVIFIITGLAANAAALPFVNDFLQPQQWLPLESAINRFVGYTFSLGIVQEVTKYLVLRYTIWQDHLRVRTDSVAYSTAAALGFATALNIQFIIANPAASIDVIALRVVENVAVNSAASLFVSLGIAETRFDHPTPFFMTITVALGALITGIATPLLSGLTNATFSIEGSFPRPLFALGFSIALFAVSLLITLFLYSAAERRERDRAKTEDVR